MEKVEVFYSSGWAVCSRMHSMIRSACAMHVTALGAREVRNALGKLEYFEGLKFWYSYCLGKG